mgnify:CR=1 FL=1
MRALELYGYNLEYRLNSNDATDEQKQEKISMLKYTYEQVLASQVEQVDTKANNIDNYHFNEEYIDNKISFDYKIKKGICESKNALYLLKLADIL